MNITIKQIDYLNIGLIVFSLVIAILLPFKLFLFAYAVLGPLHYLTEINWLDGKKYFVHNRNLIWLFVLFAFLFGIPYLFDLTALQSAYENETFEKFMLFYWRHINSLIFIALAISIALVSTRNMYIQSGIIAGAVLVAVLFDTYSSYSLWFGLFLPTVIHVFVFTILFMVYGALKSKSKPGLIASFFVLLVPIIILLIDIDPKSYVFTDTIKQTFIDSEFHILIARMAGLLGLSEGNQFFFYEKEYFSLQIFIAFAYTYHYLNWYSKTNLIRWNKNLTIKRSLVITGLWMISVGLYWYDYHTGFLILVALSVLHVIAEFPLNVISVKGIVEELRKI